MHIRPANYKPYHTSAIRRLLGEVTYTSTPTEEDRRDTRLMIIVGAVLVVITLLMAVIH